MQKKTFIGAMSVEDIRPKKTLVGQQRTFLSDLRMLLKGKKLFVHVECPACGSLKNAPLYHKRDLTYVSCSECRTGYINPRPTEQQLSEFYKHSKTYEYWSKYIFPASENMRLQQMFIPRVDKTLELCKKYRVATNALLEIGCAFGTFCVEAAKRDVFKSIVGIEPTPSLAAISRERGVSVIEKTVEETKFSDVQKFDVIVTFEVLEHLFAPLAFLKACRKALRPGGLVIFTCPNGEGFDIATLGTISDTVDHEHLNYFNPDSIQKLMKRAGFRVLEISTPGKLDADLVRTKVLEGKYKLTNQPFLQRVLIDEWETTGDQFQCFLSENKLSSHMWVVAITKKT
jgi:2-polyprenyl-3-methyl-5-hydroxy-6-metoxy-1,4-benzoquinol methylase